MAGRVVDEERWASLSLLEQMANIGSEIGRTRKWLLKGNDNLSEGAFIRGLDLIDATIKVGRRNDSSRSCLLQELCRARDLYAESYIEKDFDNLCFLEKYFGQFAMAVRR